MHGSEHYRGRPWPGAARPPLLDQWCPVGRPHPLLRIRVRDAEHLQAFAGRFDPPVEGRPRMCLWLTNPRNHHVGAACRCRVLVEPRARLPRRTPEFVGRHPVIDPRIEPPQRQSVFRASRAARNAIVQPSGRSTVHRRRSGVDGAQHEHEHDHGPDEHHHQEELIEPGRWRDDGGHRERDPKPAESKGGRGP